MSSLSPRRSSDAPVPGPLYLYQSMAWLAIDGGAGRGTAASGKGGRRPLEQLRFPVTKAPLQVIIGGWSAAAVNAAVAAVGDLQSLLLKLEVTPVTRL